MTDPAPSFPTASATTEPASKTAHNRARAAIAKHLGLKDSADLPNTGRVAGAYDVALANIAKGNDPISADVEIILAPDVEILSRAKPA